jgi:CheY-like chemotaxis protein
MRIRTILSVLVLFLGGAFLVVVGVQVRNAADEAEAARRFAAADRVRADFLAARALEGRRVTSGDAVGVIGWLGKPIDTALLGSTLRQAISRPLVDGLPRILYVEEAPDLVAIVERLLDGKAVLVSADSVGAAREQLARHRFDLAILDLSLPDGSGLELLPLLREQPSAPAVMVFAAGEVAGDVACRLEDTLVTSRTTNDELVGRILELVDGRP